MDSKFHLQFSNAAAFPLQISLNDVWINLCGPPSLVMKGHGFLSIAEPFMFNAHKMLPFGHPNLFSAAQIIVPHTSSSAAASSALSQLQLLAAVQQSSQQLQNGGEMRPPTIKTEEDEPESSSGAEPTSNSDWTMHKTDDGRTYYYHRVTKVSSWSKPDELKTPEEKEKSVWKQYKTPEGKPYYYNTVTKATTWSKPDVLKDAGPVVDEKPELIQMTSNSEIEKAMEATLMTEMELKKEEERKKEEDENSYEHNLKRRQVDKFRDLLNDKCTERRINTNMSWEQACKYIQHDPRFKILGKVSEKKQVFNAWKIQRTKDERDERRFAIKKAKEDLENWLMAHPKMRPTLRYHKAEKYFSNEQFWRAVSDSERREIFDDVKKAIEKRNEEQKRLLKHRNIKALGDILEGMSEIGHKTTWAQAQRILIENPEFAKDTILQSMDKEDALVVFQKHIKDAEEEYLKEKQSEALRTRRRERKTREAFLLFLNELFQKGTLNHTSSWDALYPTISSDQRFDDMLLTTGSTALDMFKFFVDELRGQYGQDKKVVKEILAEKGYEVTEAVAFDHFEAWIRQEEQGKKISTTNLKLCYGYFYEKAVEKQKESEKEFDKKRRRLETIFVDLLRSLSPPVEPESEWAQIRERIKDAEQFKIIEGEEAREQIFNNYLKSIQESCGHQHSSGSSKRKKEKKRNRHGDDNGGDADSLRSHKKSKRKRKHSNGEREEEENGEKKKRHGDKSPSEGELSDSGK